jgi:cobalt/nickel transport system permease protein
MNHLPPAAAGTSPVHRLPTSLKFLGMLVLILAVTMLPRAFASWLWIPAALLAVLLLAARLPLLAFFKRLLLLEPFVLGAALLALFSPAPDRMGFFLFLVARGTLALAAMILFSSTTPFTEMLQLFRRLRIPFLLVTTLALMHRYLFVLADESARMRRARQSRTFTKGRRFEWKTASTIVAQLFLRASTRADRIYDAMSARGWGAEGRR